MLKSRLAKLAVAAVTIASALGVTSLGTTAASAATAHSAATAAGSASRPVSLLARQGDQEATAVPATTPLTCTFGSSSGNVRTCFQIVGNGLFVDEFIVTATVFHSGRTLHMEVQGPSYPRGINTPSEFVSGGGVPTIFGYDFTVNGPVIAGAYHAITWRENTGCVPTCYTNIGEVTLHVVQV